MIKSEICAEYLDSESTKPNCYEELGEDEEGSQSRVDTRDIFSTSSSNYEEEKIEHQKTCSKINKEKPRTKPSVAILNLKKNCTFDSLKESRGPENQKYTIKIKAILESIYESSIMLVVMSFLTIWSLYATDISLSFADKSIDIIFTAVTSIAFFMFVLEVFAQCLYKDGYIHIPTISGEEKFLSIAYCKKIVKIGSFYFWLDFVATVSLILEISWMFGDSSGDTDTVEAEKAGSASRAGARAGRLIRLVRLIRLLRMMKLFNYLISLASNKKQMYEKSTEHLDALSDKERSLLGLGSKDDTEMNADSDSKNNAVMGESQVGVVISNTTNKRVIIMILLLLIGIPLLSYDEPNQSYSLCTQFIGNMAAQFQTNPSLYQSGLDLVIQLSMESMPIISIVINDTKYFYDDTEIQNLRSLEMLTYEYRDENTVTQVTFSILSQSIKNARHSIYVTTFVIFLLVSGTFFFSSDVNKLVVHPIECLVELVKKISINPLGIQYRMLGAEDGFEEGMETTSLLSTINKVGGLLRVGFGEAGADIIAKVTFKNIFFYNFLLKLFL